jgi:hypothetical protein
MSVRAAMPLSDSKRHAFAIGSRHAPLVYGGAFVYAVVSALFLVTSLLKL